MKKMLTIISSLMSFIILWYLCFFIIKEPLLFPSLTDIFKAFYQIMTSSMILIIIMTSLRLFISFIISALFGILLGFLSARFQWFELWQRPYITVLRTIPVLSIIVVLFILVGAMIAPYIITFLMIFPLFYQATHDGIKHIDPSILDTLKLEESRFIQSAYYIYFPCLKQGLFITVFQSLGLGLKVLVMSEYLMQVNHSIGNQILLARLNLQYADVFAWTIILIIIALSLEFIARYLKKITESS